MQRGTYHLPDVGEEPVSEVLCGLDGELGREVVDGTHKDPVPLHAGPGPGSEPGSEQGPDVSGSTGSRDLLRHVGIWNTFKS